MGLTSDFWCLAIQTVAREEHVPLVELQVWRRNGDTGEWSLIVVMNDGYSDGYSGYSDGHWTIMMVIVIDSGDEWWDKPIFSMMNHHYHHWEFQRLIYSWKQIPFFWSWWLIMKSWHESPAA